MRVKICGVTRAEDARVAGDAGAHAVGINLYAGPRRVTLQVASVVRAAVPVFVTPVALVEVRDGRLDGDVERWLRAEGVRCVQVYGEITPEALGRLASEGWRVIVVHPVSGPEFADQVSSFLDRCGSVRPAGVLLDAAGAPHGGGGGRAFDWRLVAEARERGLLNGWPEWGIGGGLTPDNVAEAIRAARPAFVDVSSGVEEGNAGVKSAGLVRRFVRRALSLSQ